MPVRYRVDISQSYTFFSLSCSENGELNQLLLQIFRFILSEMMINVVNCDCDPLNSLFFFPRRNLLRRREEYYQGRKFSLNRKEEIKQGRKDINVVKIPSLSTLCEGTRL